MMGLMTGKTLPLRVDIDIPFIDIHKWSFKYYSHVEISDAVLDVDTKL